MSPRIGEQFAKVWLAILAVVAALSLVLAIIAYLLPDHDARMYVVTTWDSDCPGEDQPEWEGLLNAWYQEVTDTGSSADGVCLQGHCEDAYGKGGAQVNADIVNSLFADKAVAYPWGNDSDHLEKATVAMLGWHGDQDEDDSSIYVGSMRVDEPDGGDCALSTDEMRIGNDGLKFLHFSSCHSMDDNQWSTWQKAYEGAHQIDGFHGIAYLWHWQAPDYKSFAFDAFHMPIADAWIDNMYRAHIDDWEPEPGEWIQVDQCPVAHVVGENAVKAWNRISVERYDYVLGDPDSTDFWGVVYPVPCYPEDEAPLEEAFEF